MFNDNANSYIWMWSLLFSVDMSDEIWLMDLWRSPTWYGSRGDWRKMRWRHKKVYPPWRMGSNQHALRSTRTCLRVLSRALPWYHLHLRVAKTSYVLLCQYDCTLFLNIRFVRFFFLFFLWLTQTHFDYIDIRVKVSIFVTERLSTGFRFRVYTQNMNLV